MNKVKQITQEQYDERFYSCPEMTNARTGLEWFPSATYILKWKPSAPELIEWIGNKGYEESRRIMNKRALSGSYVHNALELMLKDGTVYTETDIEKDFPDAKEALTVKRCLKGAMNWIENMKAKYPDFRVIEAEGSLFGADYAGTADLIVFMGGETWLIDFKTSKSIYESHKIQVVAYKDAKQCQRSAVLLLGNRTKQRYTFSEVSQKAKEGKLSEEELCRQKFKTIKDLFYLENPQAQPTKEEFPEEFKFTL